MLYICGSAILVIGLYFLWLAWEAKHAILYPDYDRDDWPDDIP